MAFKVVLAATLLVHVVMQVSALLDTYTFAYSHTTGMFAVCEKPIYQVKGEPYLVTSPTGKTYVRFAPLNSKYVQWTYIEMTDPKNAVRCLHYEETLYNNSTMVKFDGSCYRTTDAPYVVGKDSETCDDSPWDVVYIPKK